MLSVNLCFNQKKALVKIKWELINISTENVIQYSKNTQINCENLFKCKFSIFDVDRTLDYKIKIVIENIIIIKQVEKSFLI